MTTLIILALLTTAVGLCGCLNMGKENGENENNSSETKTQVPKTELPTWKNPDSEYKGQADKQLVNVTLENMSLAIIKETDSKKDNPDIKNTLKGYEATYIGNGNIYIYVYDAQSSAEADKAMGEIIESFRGATNKFIKETEINGHTALVSARKAVDTTQKITYTYYWTKGNLVFIVTGNMDDQKRIKSAAEALKI